jgi:hypothetical protein
MSILSGVGENAARELTKQIPGLEEYLAAREAQLLASIQPTIDEVKATVAAVKADVEAIGNLVTSVNTSLVPEIVKLVQTTETNAARLDHAARAFGAALCDPSSVK